MNRADVYKAIDGERDYQDAKWGNSLSSGIAGDGARSIDEFSLYIVGYAADAARLASHYADGQAKLAEIRKVAALCVACMEQHGVPSR
jgi:hypothetical protein